MANIDKLTRVIEVPFMQTYPHSIELLSDIEVVGVKENEMYGYVSLLTVQPTVNSDEIVTTDIVVTTTGGNYGYHNNTRMYGGNLYLKAFNYFKDEGSSVSVYFGYPGGNPPAVEEGQSRSREEHSVFYFTDISEFGRGVNELIGNSLFNDKAYDISIENMSITLGIPGIKDMVFSSALNDALVKHVFKMENIKRG